MRVLQISDRALVVAAELADRYITNRFLPDKAIDLVDEACSNLQVSALLLLQMGLAAVAQHWAAAEPVDGVRFWGTLFSLLLLLLRVVLNGACRLPCCSAGPAGEQA